MKRKKTKKAKRPKLPPDPHKKNARNARWAGECLKLSQKVNGSDDDNMLSDLLANLRHWCDREGRKHGVTWEQALADANGYYEEETTPLKFNGKSRT